MGGGGVQGFNLFLLCCAIFSPLEFEFSSIEWGLSCRKICNGTNSKFPILSFGHCEQIMNHVDGNQNGISA